MRTYKFMLQLCIAVGLICFFISCSGASTSSSQSQPKADSFWEGQVKPGVYTGSWRRKLPIEEYNDVECTLTIYDDHSVKYREKEQQLWGHRKTFIQVFTGTIYKHVETYNGERKVWYGIETKTETGSDFRERNLSTSLEFSECNFEIYQRFIKWREKNGKLTKLTKVQ